jgi:hypothetical protein
MATVIAKEGEGILGYADTIEITHKVSISQVTSQSGIRAAQRRGPLLYSFKVKLGKVRLNSDRYHSIINNIHEMEYGANTVSFKMNQKTGAGMSILSVRGEWNKVPSRLYEDIAESPFIIRAAFSKQMGNKVVLTGLYGGESSGGTKLLTEVEVGKTYKVWKNPALYEIGSGSTQLTTGVYSSGVVYDSLLSQASNDILNIVSDQDETKTWVVGEQITITQVLTETDNVDWSPNHLNIVVSEDEQMNDVATVSIGDYLQLPGSTKVYQAMKDSYLDRWGSESVLMPDGSYGYKGDITVKLNSPLVISPDNFVYDDNSQGARIGEEVRFHLALKKNSNLTYMPGDIVQFGTYTFEEVITLENHQ